MKKIVKAENHKYKFESTQSLARKSVFYDFFHEHLGIFQTAFVL